MQDHKPNKRLYIVVKNDGYHTPVIFEGDRFLINFFNKKEPLSVYTKKAALKLIEADALAHKNEGTEPNEYALFPLDLPYQYMSRPLSKKEKEEKKDLQVFGEKLVFDNKQELDSYFNILTRPLATPLPGTVKVETSIPTPEKTAQ